MTNISNLKIFISPLDWGLGHTSRCIPIIKTLQDIGCTIWVGVNKKQKILLSSEIDNVIYLNIEGYEISYPNNSKSMGIAMFMQIPKILNKIKYEHNLTEKLTKKYNFDLIISDNRFGLYSKETPSIYITHQINIQAPIFINKILYKIHQKYISKYSQCWIPDYKSQEISLGGNLSFSKNNKYKYIGLLSRFNTLLYNKNTEYNYLAIISGPEPQRSIFENKIVDFFLKKENKKCAIIGGKPLNQKQKRIVNIDYFSHLPSNLFVELVSVSDKIICRPGYSSIMDLCVLQKPVFFVPTPKQTEQEYLAKYYNKKYNIGFCSQEKINQNIKDELFNYLPKKQNIELKKNITSCLNSLNLPKKQL